MKNIIKRDLRKAIKEEAGQAFILVLILLLVGSVIITPLLSYIGTSLIANRLYETKADEIYAADSGIEDSLWQIRNGELSSLLTSPPYDQYDYTTIWDYTLDEQINNLDVVITMQNIWIPLGIGTPTPAYARNLAETGKLIITGTGGSGADEYDIKISFTPGAGEVAGDLYVNTLGIWLPPGYSYDAGSSSLEDDPFASNYLTSVVTSDHQGGEAVVWAFSSLSYPDLPAIITFTFTPDQPGRTPEALSWITTSGVADVPYAWDAETRVHKINSTAGDTEVEAYAIKSELQELGTAISGDYRAVGNTLMIDTGGNSRTRDTLLSESDAVINDIPADAEVAAAYLYWSGWFEEGIPVQGETIFSDDASNFSNWANPGRVWGTSSGQFTAHYSSGPQDHSYLELKDSIDLSPYTGQSVTLSFDIGEAGVLEESGTYMDPLYIALSDDGGSSWGSDIVVFIGDDPPSSFSYDIPASYLTSDFKFRFYAGNYPNGWIGGGEYAYVDNILIGTSIFNDSAGNFDNWTNGDDWDISGGEFRGHHYSGNSEADRYLTMNTSLDLSAYAGDSVSITWDQDEESGYQLEDSDRLYFAFSGDGGAGWSSNIEAFRNDNPSSPFSYSIPAIYLTDDFRLRFYLYGFSGSSEYAYLDNIAIEITQLAADETVIFKIDGNQVYFDAGVPTMGAGELTADASQIVINQSSYLPGTYFYAAMKDVTGLIRTFSAKAPDPDMNYPGNATYTTGGVDATWTADSEIAYAGWSLIVIYSSAETQGHQLYLFDTFFSSGQDNNVDFDFDGNPGGTISGFLVPEPVAGEVNAAKITVFVGEGDNWYSGDFIALNAPDNSPPTSIPDSYKLDDGTGFGVNNVWNGYSVGFAAEGIDVDTFYVTWASGLLSPGDTQAQVDIYTDVDIWELIYIILSFRSETTLGGTIAYLIK